MDKTEVVNFTTPIHIDDEDFSTECKNFLEYAKAMQLPDPTYVVMPMDTQNLVTTLVNDGKVDAFEALSTVAFHFQYQSHLNAYVLNLHVLKRRGLLHLDHVFLRFESYF